MGHESNNLGEQEKITTPPISKLKGCAHINKTKKKSKWKDPKLELEPKLKDQTILGCYCNLMCNLMW
jgi:hypothetical protein